MAGPFQFKQYQQPTKDQSNTTAIPNFYKDIKEVAKDVRQNPVLRIPGEYAAKVEPKGTPVPFEEKPLKLAEGFVEHKPPQTGVLAFGSTALGVGVSKQSAPFFARLGLNFPIGFAFGELIDPPSLNTTEEEALLAMQAKLVEEKKLNREPTPPQWASDP